MLVDKQSELLSDLLFTVHQHGDDDVTWKPPIFCLLCVTMFPMNSVAWFANFLSISLRSFGAALSVRKVMLKLGSKRREH